MNYTELSDKVIELSHLSHKEILDYVETQGNDEFLVDLKMIIDICEKDSDYTIKDFLELQRKFKRIAILDILSTTVKDRKLFEEIRDTITGNQLSKLEHIKNVVKNLRDYVGVSDCAVKEFGEVMTPIELVEEMLDTLPPEVWSNPNLKWLDPANGVGIFPCVVVYRLMEGLKEFEADDDLRYKHIMENMLYVCELQTKNMFIYQTGFDPYDEIELNIHNGSFLDKGFEEKMKIWDVEKFDIVVGNPPYQDGIKSEEANKLYPIFIYKSVNLLNVDGYCTMITPTGWFSSTSDIGKGKTGISILKIFKDKNLLYLEPDSNRLKNTFFKNIGSTFCYFLLKNNNNYIGTKINDILINIRNINALPKTQNKLSFSILEKYLNKLKFSKIEKFNWIDQNHNLLNEETKTQNTTYIYKNYHTPAKNGTYVYSSNQHKYKNYLKIIVSLSGKYIPYIDKGELGFSNMCLSIIANDLDELDLIFLNLNNKLFRFLIENNKFSGFNPRKFIIELPKLMLNTEIDYYNYFDLTQEEIDLIEKNIK